MQAQYEAAKADIDRAKFVAQAERTTEFQEAEAQRTKYALLNAKYESLDGELVAMRLSNVEIKNQGTG